VPARLASLDLPVVAINPAEPASDAAALRRHGVELASLPGAGHFAMLEDPARFNALLADHAARLFERRGVREPDG
jgi:pimeloyl-ACP methyl ester carboxylesterase